jgi:hypothetical protein
MRRRDHDVTGLENSRQAVDGSLAQRISHFRRQGRRRGRRRDRNLSL